MREVEQGERDAARITAHLWRVMKAQGVGTITRVEEAFGLRSGTLYRRKRRAGFRVQQVCAILRFLDYPVSVFFAEAFDDEPQSAGDRFRAQGAALLAKGYGGKLPDLALPTRPDVLTVDELDALDRLRFDDPKHAANQARELTFLAASEGRQNDASACAGRWGSALRACERWHAAHAAITWSLNTAPAGPILADAWRRAGSIVSDYGCFDDAAELARLSLTEFAELGDDTGMGRSLISRGTYLRRAGDYRGAIRCLRSALTKLPACEHHNRIAAHIATGLACVAVGDLDAAEQSAAHASRLSWTSRAGAISLRWLRARIATARGEFTQAATLYERIAEELKGAPGDAALLGAELARVYLQARRPADAVEIASGLAALAMPQRSNRIVSAAIRDLWCLAAAGELTLEALDRLIYRIRRGRNRRAAAQAPRPASGSTGGI